MAAVIQSSRHTALLPFMVPARLEDGEYKLTVRIDYGAEEPLFLEHLFSVKEGEIREEA